MTWLEQLKKDVHDLSNQGKARASICSTCTKRNFGLCTECGCFLSIKVMIPEAKCPLDKW